MTPLLSRPASLRQLAPRLLAGVLLLSVAVPSAAAAVDPTLDWIADPSFPSGYVSNIASDSQGNVYACSGSNTVSVNTGVHLFQVSKFDSAGALSWTRSFAPAGGFADRANWLAVDSGDNVVVTGWHTPAQSSVRELVTLKYDAQGTLLWDRRFVATTSGGNIGQRVEVDAADNAYVFATGSDGGGVNKIFKYDPNGNLLWMRGHTPAGATLLSARSMKVTPSGDVAYLVALQQVDFHTRAYDALGNLLFENTYVNGVDGGDDLAWGLAGELYVCGSGAIGGALPVSPVVVKYTSTGAFAWERGFTGPFGPSGIFRRMTTDSAGNVIAVGMTQSNALLPYVDWTTVKYDPAGNELWSVSVPGFDANDEYITWVETGPDDSVYVAGQAGKLPSNTCTLLPSVISDVETTVRRYDSGGSELWTLQVDCSGLPSSLALAPGDAVLVTTPARVVRIEQSNDFTSFCFGDGSSTPCPCGNNAVLGAASGCANQSGLGAVLTGSGLASATTNGLTFAVTDASPGTFAVLVSADNPLPSTNPGAGIHAFDGLRCVGGSLVRHGSRATNASGASVSPWGPPGGPIGGIVAQGGFVQGRTRHFQVFYREDATLGCQTGQNTSNAVTVTVGP